MVEYVTYIRDVRKVRRRPTVMVIQLGIVGIYHHELRRFLQETKVYKVAIASGKPPLDLSIDGSPTLVFRVLIRSWNGMIL